MQALILAGGEGKRMFPVTKKNPKVLLPIAGKPFKRHEVEKEIVKSGFKLVPFELEDSGLITWRENF